MKLTAKQRARTARLIAITLTATATWWAFGLTLGQTCAVLLTLMTVTASWAPRDEEATT